MWRDNWINVMVLCFYVLSISIQPSAATSALTTDQCPRCAAENNQLTVAVSNTKPRCAGPGAGAGCGDDQVMIQKEAEEPLNLNFLKFFISAGLRKGGVDKSVPSPWSLIEIRRYVTFCTRVGIFCRDDWGSFDFHSNPIDHLCDQSSLLAKPIH